MRIGRKRLTFAAEFMNCTNITIMMNLRKFLFAAVMLATVSVTAQQLPPIPIDEDVRIGKLDNGLTYYIRHNEWPEHVANFYIAQRVGSIQENDQQRGLAHFLEHMAFNGSEHFPGNGIIDFTRSLGVEFGSDLNAYTSIDQTVYRVCNVPTTKGQAALDSCLLILKDWSNGLLLDPEEIDKERDVVHNEWRLGEGPSQRMITRALPKMYPGSKYGERMPIGLMSVIDSFRPQTLRDYYHLWYRPDNQALIIVGDVDVDHTEQKIKEMFSSIQVPAGAPQVIPEEVPDNDEAIYIFEKDKEMQMSQIIVFMKHDATKPDEKVGMEYLIEVYVKAVIAQMFNGRMRELAEDPDCPFLQAGGDDDNYLLASTKDAFQLIGIPKEGRDMETLTALIRETRRVSEFGFTATEYERAKADYLSSLERQYTNRAKITNDQYGNDYRDNYLTNEPIPSIEKLYQIMQMLSSQIPCDVVNMVLPELITANDTNLVVMEWAREAEGLTYPTEADMRAAVAAARAEQITPYVDNVKDEPLMSEMPQKGAIVSEKENQQFGYRELKLSNGATVILLPTDYKDDEVQLQAFAKGGKSLYGPEDYTNLKFFDEIIGSSGLGNFSNNELTKALAGKEVNADASMGVTRQYVTAHSTPKDLETMFQMTYLYFTSVSKDERQFQNLMGQFDMALKNKSLSPDAVFSDSLSATVFQHNPRFTNPEATDLPAVNYDRILQIQRERFSNASQFTFVIVGKFDATEIRPFIEQYIASLPSTGQAPDNFRDVTTFFKGEVVNNFAVKTESPKAMAVEVWKAPAPYTLENIVKLDAVGQILSMLYLKTIREEASAAYSCGAAGSFNLYGTQPLMLLQAYCPMNPDKQALAVELLHKGIADMAQQVDPALLTQVKEAMLNQADINAKRNGHWMNVLTTWKDYGIDIETDYKKTVEALTPESVGKFLRDMILSSGDHMELIMHPEQ